MRFSIATSMGVVINLLLFLLACYLSVVIASRFIRVKPVVRITQCVKLHKWHKQHGINILKTKLYYVAGYNKAISYLTRYMPARPQGLIDFNAKLSPAINMRDFHKKGAVFILTTDQSGLTPVEAGFPSLG